MTTFKRPVRPLAQEILFLAPIEKHKIPDINYTILMV